MLRHALACATALALALIAVAALADEPLSRCRPSVDIRKILESGRSAAAGTDRDAPPWVTLTSEQRAFLMGVWAMNPETPAGLPYGDKAVVVAERHGGGALIFFIDGELACDGFAIPDELVEMLRHVGAGDVYHEGQL